MPGKKLTELTQLAVPATNDVTYVVSTSNGSTKCSLSNLIGSIPSICTGRVTAQSGTPVPVSDIDSTATLFFTPYNGNVLSLYNGSGWSLYKFTQLSCSLSGVGTGQVRDLFVWDNNGTLTLSLGPAWSTTLLRGTGAGTTELILQDGVLVNRYAITGGPSAYRGKYVGSYMNSEVTTGSALDTAQHRRVYSHYNRLRRPLFRNWGSTPNHTYTTAAWRALNNNTNFHVSVVNGESGSSLVSVELITGLYSGNASNTTAWTCISDNSTNSGDFRWYMRGPSVISYNNYNVAYKAQYVYNLTAGLHRLYIIQHGSGASVQYVEGVTSLHGFWEC